MLELRAWIESRRADDRPWLMLGKGPTFGRRQEFPLDDFNLLGLNNVAGAMRVDVAHIIDVDVVGQIADRLAENCGVLLMPRYPHVGFTATDRRLEDFFDELPVLRELDEQNRLVWYSAATGAPVKGSPVMRVRYFSSEAAMDILGEMGVTVVRTLGIDGGTSYADSFAGTPALGNGLPSFDAQFREIEDIVRDRGIDYDPLVEPLKVFVGVDDSQLVAARVLEYTIRKHASCPVRFIPMVDVPTPQPRDPANRGRTGFSFSRFHIPRLAGFRGRGVYMDADMQVFSDVAELLRADMGSHTLLCTRQDEPPPAWEENDWFHPGRQMSMMVLDCERLEWDVDEIIAGMDRGEYGYTDLLFDMCIVPGEEIDDSLPPAWNHLEHYEPGTTRLLHYTVVPTQPWKSDANPLRELWEQEFAEAEAAGLIYPTELRQAVWAGHAKRSLAGLAPASLPVRALDRALARIVPRARATLYRFPRLRHRAVSMLRSR
jgi:hypothetical protein